MIDACLAVACGLATHVLCFRSVWEGSAQGAGGRAAVMPGGENRGSGGNAAAPPGRMPRADGIMEWTLPYGAPSAAPWIAMFAQRHFHEYGTTREQLAQIALNARKNAALNPKGIYKDPMTMDDYLSARMISSPFCLFDCDVPCDGGTAMIVSRADTAPDLRKPPIQVEAVGTALHGRPSWDQFDDLATMACRDAGAQLWTRTDLKPSDVQLAEMYDGFSFITMAWLEAMQFCGVGESGPFVEGGQRIALDGQLPLNTNGGQLSSGRLHGFGFLHEACIAALGRGRRPSGARRPRGRRRLRRRRPPRRRPPPHPPPLSDPLRVCCANPPLASICCTNAERGSGQSRTMVASSSSWVVVPPPVSCRVRRRL